MTTVIILISFLCFSGSAQPGRDTGDQTLPSRLGCREGLCPELRFPLTYTAPMSLSSLGFFLFLSIKVLIVLGHRVSGKILLVYIRKCLALNSKHIKDLAISFYEYERLWAGMGLPTLIRCWHQNSCGFGVGFIIRKLHINFLQGINQLSEVRTQLDVFTRPIAPQSNCSWLYTSLLLTLNPLVISLCGMCHRQYNLLMFLALSYPTLLTCIHTYMVGGHLYVPSCFNLK